MKRVYHLVLLLIGMSACTFPMNDENHVALSTTPKAGVSHVALDGLTDTTYLTSTLKVSYNIVPYGQVVGSVYVTIGNHIYSLPGPRGEFYLFPENSDYPKGGYVPFQFMVVTNTGTGSLADVNKKEYQVFSISKVLAYGMDPPPVYVPPVVIEPPSPPIGPFITDAKINNGSILVSWSTSNLVDARTGLYLKASYYKNEGDATPYQTEVVGLAKNATSYVDKNFVAGTVKYSLAVIESSHVGDYGPAISFTRAPQELDIMVAPGTGFSWHKSKLYANISGYEIVDSESGVIQSHTSVNDTIATGLPFARTFQLKVREVSNVNSNYSAIGLTNREFFVGTRTAVSTNGWIYPDPEHSQLFFVSTSKYFTKVKDGIRDSVLTAVGQEYFTPDHSYFYSRGANNVFTKISTVDLSIEYFTVPLPTAMDSSVKSFVIHDQRIICVESNFDQSFSRIGVYDINSGLLVQHFPLTGAGYPFEYGAPVLSDVGGAPYVTPTSTVLEVNPDGTILSSHFFPSQLAAFNASRTRYICIDNSTSTVRSYEVPGFSEVSSRPSGDLWGSFDPKLGLVFYYSSGIYNVVDPETGNMLRQGSLDTNVYTQVWLTSGVLCAYDHKYVYMLDLGL